MRTRTWLVTLVALPVLGAGLLWVSLLIFTDNDSDPGRLIYWLSFWAVPFGVPVLLAAVLVRDRMRRLLAKIGTCIAVLVLTAGCMLVSFGAAFALIPDDPSNTCPGGRIYC